MGKVIIIDDNDNEVSYDLKNYRIDMSDDCLILTLELGKYTAIYKIHSDTREKDIVRIKHFVSDQLNDALVGKRPLIISEYLERDYVFIGKDDTRRQFTAQKIN